MFSPLLSLSISSGPSYLGLSYYAIIQCPPSCIYFLQSVSLIFRKCSSDHAVHVLYHFLSLTFCGCVHSHAVHPGACGDQMLMCLVSFFYHSPPYFFNLNYIFMFCFFGVCVCKVHECVCTTVFTWGSEDNLPIYTFEMDSPTDSETCCF